MAHVPVVRRSMRPDEWTKIRMGWLKRHIISEIYEIAGWTIREGVQEGENSYIMEDDEPRPLRKGDLYFTPDGTVFLDVTATLPEELCGREGVRLRLTTASEMIVRINGALVGGLDPNRETLPLPASADGVYHIEIEGYDRSKPDDDRSVETRHLKGCRQEFQGGQFVTFNEAARSLYYDVLVFMDILNGGQFDEDVCALVSDRLYKALDLVDWDAHTGYDAASAYIQKELYDNKLFHGSGAVALVAHSHLDIAYHWCKRHAVQKNARTTLIQLELMDRYPEFRYTQTQAYLFETLERNYPDLFARMAAKVKSGEFELVGGMYVESDCNVPTAESMVRQFLYGQKYFEEKFGIRCRNCWVPDVFGNSAIMPQILQKSGIDFFVSNKMSTWNDTNRFPHNHFLWKGLDGSIVKACVPPTHFITSALPSEIVGNWAAFQDKDCGQTLCMYGYGDGGSGVTEEMLETIRRLGKISAMPHTEVMGGQEFLDRNFTDETPLDTWDGELYLEMHRGTFTTKADLKKWNRKLEILLREVEMVCTLRAMRGEAYPAEAIEALWKKLLLNQFHDILPGSHNRAVFLDTMKDYYAIEEEALQLLGEGGDKLFNSLGFTRVGPQFIVNENGADERMGQRGDWQCVEVAPLTSVAIPTVKNAAADWLAVQNGENGAITVTMPNLTIIFNADGSIASMVDDNGREYVDGEFNKIKLFEDIPGIYDAWDILPTYREVELPIELAVPLHFESANGETAVFSCTLKTKKSTWTRKLRVFKSANQVEVENHVDWHEDHVLAKAEFNCAVRTPYALCDTSAGYIHRETNRNTTWQQARYETCHHKWVDLSEADGGIALINESKYGVGIWENTLSLSLLRATKRPDLMADRGEHDFCYLIVPHEGTAVQANINRQAWQYNVPLRRLDLPAFELPELGSLHVQSVKQCEDGEGIILRLSEQDGKRGKVRFAKPVTVTNLLEDAGEAVTEIAYKPFEIITVKQ